MPESMPDPEVFAEVTLAAVRDHVVFGQFARMLSRTRLYMLAPEAPALLAATTRHAEQKWVATFSTLRGALEFSRKSDFLVVQGDHLVTLLPAEVGLLVDPAEPHGVGVLFRSPAREPLTAGAGYLNRVGTKVISSLMPAETLFWTANIHNALAVLRQSAYPLPFDTNWGTPTDWEQVPGALLKLGSKTPSADTNWQRLGKR
ncbi:hypothetical protein DMC61_11320 [Amycolatopsis sp. WAC 04169]|uniref:hypothetical protein n=1 Tax=Amycolatopsis sp. WAC 04169 TaxID=2203197 RepID=UPI000F774C8F|nr:hypothetical protein [Amycolatopsis sp. WAC 04169]RSN32772.1 hypothetical protein DMC61_11320 [Amycolatopsis sp. WAC 04169]